MLDLGSIEAPNKYSPYTWEGCIVKVSDKIAYLGRDIEDALTLSTLTQAQIKELRKIVKVPIKEINNTVLMHDLIMDLCSNSSPEQGICFSTRYLDLMNEVKRFNYRNIYYHDRLKSYNKYSALIINSIFQRYRDLYREDGTVSGDKKSGKTIAAVVSNFCRMAIEIF